MTLQFLLRYCLKNVNIYIYIVFNDFRFSLHKRCKIIAHIFGKFRFRKCIVMHEHSLFLKNASCIQLSIPRLYWIAENMVSSYQIDNMVLS